MYGTRPALTRSGVAQVDQTTAKMLVNMVEALEAARAPLQHVYFSQGIKYYVRRPALPCRTVRAHACVFSCTPLHCDCI